MQLWLAGDHRCTKFEPKLANCVQLAADELIDVTRPVADVADELARLAQLAQR